jgi:hypothetical protein
MTEPKPSADPNDYTCPRCRSGPGTRCAATPETVPALEGYGTGEGAQDPSTSYVPMYPVNVSGTVSSPNPGIPTRNGHMAAAAAGGPPLALTATSDLGADGSGTDPAWLRPLHSQYGLDRP